MVTKAALIIISNLCWC